MGETEGDRGRRCTTSANPALGALALIVVVLACAATLPAPVASQQAAPRMQITDIDATAYPELRAVVTALDGAGIPVAGLTAAGFQATEDGQPLEVADARSEQLSLGVAVVIDTSGSMAGEPMAAAKEAAKTFVANLREGDSAAVFAFSNVVRPIVPFTQDRAAIATGIDSLQAVGDTALFEAAQVALYATNGVQLPRRAVVLLSDGENTAGDPNVTAAGSVDVARATGIPVYTIGFGSAPDTSYLQQLSDASAGQYRIATTGSIAEVYGDITRLLESQYTLTLRAPGEASAGGSAVLRVTGHIAGQQAAAERAFERPAPPVPATEPAPAPLQEEDSGSSRAPLYAVGGVAGFVIMAIMAMGAFAFVQRQRTRRRQLAVVAPNLRQAEAQGLPEARGSTSLDIEDGFGLLTSLDGAEPGQTWEFSATPIRLGSAPECEVRLPVSASVAPQHAAVWMRDGKIMLRHTGGSRRPTLVGGRPVDWIILDSGDEVVIGEQRWRVDIRTV